MMSVAVFRPVAAGPYLADQPWRLVLLIAAAYLTLLTVGGDAIFALPHPPLYLTFNSMLDHLLHGGFDVDPAVVGDEGFTRDGHVYAYWGIFPALLRLPLILLPRWQAINVTVPSCLLASVLALAAKLWTLRRIAMARPELPAWLLALVMAVLVLSGAQICFLRPSIYQEVCWWAGAFGALFVAGAMAGQLGGFTRDRLLVMALACAGALLTRVSVGIGLIAAFGLLTVVEILRDRNDLGVLLGRFAMPIAVLVLAGAATALVNIERWGDPLTFADYHRYNYNLDFPDRMVRTARYGLFNIQRIPFGLVYYLFPIWVVPGSGGTLLMSGMRDRLIDSAELPPASFLLTDPLLLMLGAVALASWWGKAQPRLAPNVAIATGLAAPPLLMLTAISMCFRYRMDFYPLIEFLAFSGLASINGASRLVRPPLAVALALLGIVGSHAALLLYDLGELGPAQRALGQGIGHYYAHRAAQRWQRSAPPHPATRY